MIRCDRSIASPPEGRSHDSETQFTFARANVSRTVRRMLCRRLLFVFFALTIALRAADESLARYDQVMVEPAKTSIYVGSVTMAIAPSTRKAGAYESTYTAKVFPYFFMSEKGKLVLEASDEQMRKLARGEAVDFTGTGENTSGEARRFEGRATPSDATSGKLKVHVYVSKRIDLIFNMTYRFSPAAP